MASWHYFGQIRMHFPVFALGAALCFVLPQENGLSRRFAPRNDRQKFAGYPRLPGGTAGVPGAVRPAAPGCCNGTRAPSGSAPVLWEHPASFTTHRWDLAQKKRRSKANFAPVPGDPYRIRTDVNGVRGRCLNHLTNGPLVHLHGLEPGTH